METIRGQVCGRLFPGSFQENPTKGYTFHLESDRELVVMEDSSGHDGELSTLRSVLQEVERAGLVEFELAGHTVQRPAAVCQGEEGDRPGSNQSFNLKGKEKGGVKAKGSQLILSQC